MRADLKIDGLDSLRRRMGSASRAIDREVRPEIRAAATLVRDEARRRAPGRVMQPSIQHRVLAGGMSAIVGSVAKTALSIHQGRRPGAVVRVGLILGWIRRYGIVAAVPVSRRRTIARRGTARRRDALNQLQSQEREQALAIVERIRARGTRPLPFLIPAAIASRDRVQRRIRDGVARAIRQVARA